MRGKDMVALGRVVLAKRERVIMLQPWDKGLLGTTLRYPYEVRDSKDYFYDIPDVKIAPEMLTLAEHILKSKEATFDPSKFVDRYEQAVIQLLEKKREGLPAPEAARSLRRPDQRRQPDGRSAPQRRRRYKIGCNPKDGRAGNRSPEEGQEAHPRPGRDAAANCRAKRATQSGRKARCAAESAQVWIAANSISGRLTAKQQNRFVLKRGPK
jgi:hypothetical protein